jgi:2-keto-4-pentenoate hydratase/2-oxohepta-3-ene-1,7-dioic acid hydratase in catechol pathway
LKLFTFEKDGAASYGAHVAGGAIDLGALFRDRYKDLRAVLSDDGLPALASAIDSGSPDLDLNKITFRPLIESPGKIICVGLNYESHRKETGRDKASHPAIFTRFADTQVGHEGGIVIPKVSTALDYEGELAVVIGKGGRYIPEKDAYDHIAGYSVYNDATVRDWQRHTIQFTPGKNFPNTGAFGPTLVTPDDVENLQNCVIETRLNGKVMQHATLSQLIFPIPTLINYISSFTPLSPGDVIATGTPGGVGFKRDPVLFMKPGDEIVVEIDQIGLLRNRIVNE